MLKMFSTQLAGLLGRIQEKQEENLEDAARLLAQAAAGEGRIFIFGAGEMEAIALEATLGAEPLSAAVNWDGENIEGFTAPDRALIAARFSGDPSALNAAKLLQKEGIPFAAISASLEGTDSDTLEELADVHVGLLLKKGLLPDETGGRFGFPAPIAGLFAYYGIKFIIDEILAEYEEQ
ncbi:DUF2529 domain-containing protein [Neobacillus piezotolerans]|uniref:DUF2529 domain-containing protein n=1 Tax=Neobacillus piezotolerans TaxID=2259171 RepID=A0A3D8GTU1_9BACI|nr:DUF2529 family protein [Neobacillus piezotolerans]RDU37466.1 DUF2529 domain-containing protein [Neobacillus piezotolerans]